MNKRDLGIIHAVSTVLFQWTATENTKNDAGCWVRPKRSEIFEEEYRYRFNLSTKQIDEKWYFELWGEFWNEDRDEWGEPYIIGYFPIKNWKQNCWYMDQYCDKIDKLLEAY